MPGITGHDLTYNSSGQVNVSGRLNVYEDVALAASDSDILDENGKPLIKHVATASAVNEVTVTNAATGTNPAITATGTDAAVGLELKTTGTGWLHHRAATVAATNGSLAVHKSVIAKSNDGTNTITAAEMRAGIWEHSGLSAGRTDTTPTAALLVADIPGAQVGTTYMVVFANTDDDQVLTIGAGAGVTLKGDATIPAGNNALGIVHFTNVTASSEAVTIYLLGAAA
jgi:hypothetical protein